MSTNIQAKCAFIEYAKVVAESKSIEMCYCPTFSNFYNGLSAEDQTDLMGVIEYIATANHNVSDLAYAQDDDVEKFISLYVDHALENVKAEDKSQSAEALAETLADKKEKKRKTSKLVQKFCDQIGITDPEIISILNADDVRECYKGKGVGHMYLALRSKLISMWHETNDTKYLYFAFLRINAKTLTNLPVANYFGVAEYYEEARRTPYF